MALRGLIRRPDQQGSAVRVIEPDSRLARILATVRRSRADVSQMSHLSQTGSRRISFLTYPRRFA